MPDGTDRVYLPNYVIASTINTAIEEMLTNYRKDEKPFLVRAANNHISLQSRNEGDNCW